MTLKIGEKIKNLRKQQNITQEKLAAYLNISYQAVSKWENDTALPDITLIPQIANFFGVSADELLGMKDIEETEELKESEAIYRENNRQGKMLDNIVLSRKILEKYPRNYQWMLNLAYPLIQYNDSDEHSKYSKEHNFIQEAINICERILEDCTDDGIRHSAIQILCYSYPDVGKKELALNLANKMPDIYVCKESLLAHIYEGEERIKCCQKNLLTHIDLCVGLIYFLTSNNLMGKELTVYDKIKFFETSIDLLKLILPDDQNNLFFNCRFEQTYIELAKLWCMTNQPDKAIKYLILAEKSAIAYDDCADNGEQQYKSIFVNRLTFNPKSVGKNFEGTEKEILSKILDNNNEFDILRDLDEYKNLQSRLKA